MLSTPMSEIPVIDFLPFAGALLLSPLLLFYLFPLESHLRSFTSWKLFNAHPSKAVKVYLYNAKNLLEEGFAKVRPFLSKGFKHFSS